MAIRSGSGGLKYALPSQAQIQAQQAAAAASAGGSASASAYGANRRYAGLKKQLQYQAYESGLDRAFRAQQAFFQREHEAGGQLEAQRAALERQQAGFAQQTELQQAQFGQQTAIQQASQQFTADQAALDRQFTTGRDAARAQQDQAAFEMERDAGIEEGIRAGKLELPATAQRELEGLEATKAARNNLDPEQQAEFDAAYAQERRRILRTARQPAGPDATGRARQGLTYFDPDQNDFVPKDKAGPKAIAGRVNEKGEFLPIVEQQKPEDGKDKEATVKRARELMADVDPETGVPKYKSFEEAFGAAQEEQAVIDRVYGSQQQAGVPNQGIGTSGSVAAGASGVGLGAAGGGGVPAPVPPIVENPAERLDAIKNEIDRATQNIRQGIEERHPIRSEAGMGDSVRQRSGSDIPGGTALPEGLPEGSVMINGYTIQLPNGRLLRRKGQ